MVNSDNIFNEIKRTMDKNTQQSINQAMFTNCSLLGTITSSGLKLDNFKHEINSYLILDHNGLSVTSSTDREHSHTVKIPSLVPGDRVLVAQIGSESVVIGKVRGNG